MKLSDYTFETFIPTPSNQLARLSAQKICETPGVYNPLYLYGPSGAGKTHLLYAIAKEYESKQKTTLCISANQFLEEMLEAIRTGANTEFKEKYRQADVLLIDGLQHISGKEASQEELFKILDRRLFENKQVVVVGDNSLGRIPDLGTELQACLSGGLCIEIQTPDLDATTKIISEKLQSNGIEWPIDACRYVALNISSGIKQIEGEINKILAFRELF